MIEHTFHSDWRHVALPLLMTILIVCAALTIAIW